MAQVPCATSNCGRPISLRKQRPWKRPTGSAFPAPVSPPVKWWVHVETGKWKCEGWDPYENSDRKATPPHEKEQK
jgi:hypothetical protein